MPEVKIGGLVCHRPKYPAGEEFDCPTCKATIVPLQSDFDLPKPDRPILEPVLGEDLRKLEETAWTVRCPGSDKYYEHRIRLTH